MNPNPKFHWKNVDSLRSFAQDLGFGTLVAATPDGLRVAHVPFVFLDDQRIGLHLARSNALVKSLDGATALMVVTGPNGYVSPDWYGLDRNQVPTWNYQAVELEGVAKRMDHDALLAQVDALSHEQERRLAPKAPWTRGKMDAEIADKMVGAIVGFELRISEWRRTAKLNQNKPVEARASVGRAFEGLGKDDVAALVRNPPE